MSVSVLDPETDIMDQFLDPETDIMGERTYIDYKGLKVGRQGCPYSYKSIVNPQYDDDAVWKGITLSKVIIKGSVWESDKLILNDGRWFPETADVIFFSEKFVFQLRQQVRPFPIRRRVQGVANSQEEGYERT